MSYNNMLGSRVGTLNTNMNAGGLYISKDSQTMMKTVLDPLGARDPAFVTDSISERSLCLIDSNQKPTFTNTNADPVSGIVLWLTFGSTSLQVNYGSLTVARYCLNWAYVGSNGEIVLDDVTGKYYQVAPINYTAIINTGADDALVTSMRCFAMGIRLLPIIEYVTDPS